MICGEPTPVPTTKLFVFDPQSGHASELSSVVLESGQATIAVEDIGTVLLPFHFTTAGGGLEVDVRGVNRVNPVNGATNGVTEGHSLAISALAVEAANQFLIAGSDEGGSGLIRVGSGGQRTMIPGTGPIAPRAIAVVRI